ncbi:MAG: hypothetical protein IJS95_02165, partial [Prevotella sp.]|nr:hypothetical protein [Prevotella sp.]
PESFSLENFVATQQSESTLSLHLLLQNLEVTEKVLIFASERDTIVLRYDKQEQEGIDAD